MRFVSLPVQLTTCRWIVPVPEPKWALLKATASVEINAYFYEIAFLFSGCPEQPAQHLCIHFNRVTKLICCLFKLVNTKSGKFNVTVKESDLEWNILAVDTPQWHQYYSSHHHTQYPTHCLYISPPCLHLEYYLQRVVVHQLSMELQWNYIHDLLL